MQNLANIDGTTIQPFLQQRKRRIKERPELFNSEFNVLWEGIVL
jgi:hypothetical protein